MGSVRVRHAAPWSSVGHINGCDPKRGVRFPAPDQDGVTQWLEYLTVDQKVEGSSPFTIASCELAWGVAFSSHEKTERTRAKKRVWLLSLKKGPCADCGVQYEPWIMQWDHLPERGSKEFQLASVTANNISRKRILNEIKKCELVCANCHMARSHNRLSTC